MHAGDYFREDERAPLFLESLQVETVLEDKSNLKMDKIQPMISNNWVQPRELR